MWNEKTRLEKVLPVLQAATCILIILWSAVGVYSVIKDWQEEKSPAQKYVVNEHSKLRDDLMRLDSLRLFDEAIYILGQERDVIGISISPDPYSIGGSVTYVRPGREINCNCQIWKSNEKNEEKLTNIEKVVADFCDMKGALMREELRKFLATREPKK